LVSHGVTVVVVVVLVVLWNTVPKGT
jgi:hypothetical protein